MFVEEWLGSDNQLGIDIWNKKYCFENESFEDWLDRVSGGVEEYKQLIREKKFLPGGRILANRGLNKKGEKVTYSNCYVIPAPEDSIESIFDCAKAMARTFSYGGGVGIDISKLAPRGARVNNTAKETSGATSFMDLYSMVTGLIGQNGRRGALMISLACDHPDIQEFIDLKSDLDKVTKANISVRVTKDFMNAVINNEDFKLSFTREETGEVIEKIVKAEQIFDRLSYMNWNYAEPGILFWDRIKEWNLLSNNPNFEYAGVNPCLTGDTLIMTTKGQIPIQELVGTTPDVYCMDENGELVIKPATKVWLTRKDAQTIKVTTAKGSIKCTPDHLIHTRNRGWVPACELKHGDKLTGLNRCMGDETHVVVGLSGKSYVAEHRLVAGYYYDIEGKDVYHSDGDTLNNSIDNLIVLSHEEHSRITNTGRSIDVVRDALGRYAKKERNAKRFSFNLNKSVGTNWYVQSVEWLDEHEDVYDMTVSDVHNFVANSIIVHNCAEEPLPAGGSCLLGSINLAAFVKDREFQWKDFIHSVHVSVDFLNDILDEGLKLHPLEVQRNSVRSWRQIGLGIMGLADMLIKMEIEYGSKESIELCDEVGRILIDSALDESCMLADENGSYPMFDKKVLDTPFIQYNASPAVKEGIRQFGLYNSQLLTCAPTGTLSTMLGISGGIEPIFANYYTRRTQSLHGHDEIYKVYTPIVKEYMEKHNISDDSLLPEWFITAPEIDPMNRILMQSTWQKHIDASISSTINLPNDCTVKDVKNIYLEAYRQGLKGITVYRAGCKREGILVKEGDNVSEKDHEKLPWGTVIKVNNDLLGMKKKITSGCGNFHLQVFYDEDEKKMWETFVSLGDGAGCERNLEFISRLMSKCLRAGVSVEEIIETAKSIRPCLSYCMRSKTKGDTSPGTSCAGAIGHALEEFNEKLKSIQTLIPEVTKEITSVCPECGAPLYHEGGCDVCKECGYSHCG